MDPVYFPSPAAFRAWLEARHGTEQELWVGYHKRATGRPSLTWPESVDEALCFGWIDGLRRSVDAERYAIRFTPRRPGSAWSEVNLARVAALTAEGRMRPAGLAVYEARRPEAGPAVPRAERPERLPDDLDAALRDADDAAWRWFAAQSVAYRRMMVDWVTAAKREATRRRRLERLAAAAALEQRWVPGQPHPAEG